MNDITVHVIIDGYSTFTTIDKGMTFERLAKISFKEIKSSFPNFSPKAVSEYIFDIPTSESDQPLSVSRVSNYMKHADTVIIRRKAHNA